MNRSELKAFLDEKAEYYEHPRFLTSDPIQIPHRFTRKEDIEISAFLTATIAWGNRKSIINNATQMMELMGNAPYDFIMSHQEKDLDSLDAFVHRTFNGEDFSSFVRSLRHLYEVHEGLEAVFAKHQGTTSLQESISRFKSIFFEVPHAQRTQKHVSDPEKGSAAKRLNMFLRWMVRSSQKGVDFGIWESISPSKLSCPLDVHSGNVARKLKLIRRKANDAKALQELDKILESYILPKLME
ncbi:MAG: TIGR02757 family protein [Bacteroidota bacterium]